MDQNLTYTKCGDYCIHSGNHGFDGIPADLQMLGNCFS